LGKLPVLSARELIKVLKRFGFYIDHQTGSHIILKNEEPPCRRITVPNHKEIAKGTLRSILRSSGITKRELIENL
jgi:predicted RNA binding protein YcfA (HicA-like mRNA interferase family)